MRVAIIGAGLAGLVAGRELVHGGADVIVGRYSRNLSGHNSADRCPVFQAARNISRAYDPDYLVVRPNNWHRMYPVALKKFPHMSH